MSDAVTATGILVKRALLATPTVFTTVAEITEVDPGGKSRNKVETSTHNEGTESHVLGILRQADPSFKINLVNTAASHIAIESDIDNNTKNQWQIVFPSGKSRTGPGYVQAFKLNPVPVDGKQGAMITLSWAGTVTEA